MSVSRHPIALRLERQVGSATKLLATVMVLPLIDGIFPALIIAGVMSTATGVVETGILIFGGSATAAVILAEMDGSRRQMVTSVLLIGAVIVPIAALEAAFAPTFKGFLDLAIFERFAGLVILTIAAKTASSEIGEFLPSPGVIISLGLVASFDPSGFALRPSEMTSPEYVLNGAAAAGVGVAFALSVALLSPHLRGRVDIDRFRFGSAVALGVLALPILLGPFDLMQTEAPIALAVLAVTTLFAYDPNAGPVSGAADDSPADGPAGGDARDTGEDGDDGNGDGEDSGDAPADDELDPTDPPLDTPPDAPGPIVDDDVAVLANGGDRDANDDDADPFTDDDSRAPWL